MRVMLLCRDRDTVCRFHTAAKELGDMRITAVKRVTDALERLFRETYDALLSEEPCIFHPRIRKSPVLWPEVICLLYREPAIFGAVPEDLTYGFPIGEDPVHILQRVASFRGNRPIQTDPEVLISGFLQRVGVPVSMAGFPCLCEAIRLILPKDQLPGTASLNDIYLILSSLMRVSPSVIEHAIRNAIGAAWIRADAAVLEHIFGYTIDAERAAPSNAAFLFRVADHIKMHQGEGDVL